MSPHPVPAKHCAGPDCDASFRDHRWGTTKAHGEGWFIGRGGISWCPQHLPQWLSEWRRREGRAH